MLARYIMDYIKFKAKDHKDCNNQQIYGIEIYRSHKEDQWGYVDMLHPMSISELIVLKKFLQELINSDNDRH
jgi:hypothetical protein|tara:strand:+ start:307 stop:522 length:216 start_codon:yes stop_codon:yes gene_type:complete